MTIKVFVIPKEVSKTGTRTNNNDHILKDSHLIYQIRKNNENNLFKIYCVTCVLYMKSKREEEDSLYCCQRKKGILLV